MERDPRESESDLLSPLRTHKKEQENAPVPDVDEQLRNLELNPPSLVLISSKGIKSPKKVTSRTT